MDVVAARGESLTSQVRRMLRTAIIVGELAPGSLHSVAKLADKFQVSRSPVREALISLADQGMVAFERNRGVRILHTTVHDLEEIITLRLLLEVPATYRAAEIISVEDLDRLRTALGKFDDFTRAETMAEHQGMDVDFHRAILEAAGNERLVDIVDNLRSQQNMRGVSAIGRHRALADVYREHQEILGRVEARDPHGAAAAMRAHLARSAVLLVSQQTGESPTEVAGELPWLDVFGAIGGPGTD